MDNKNLIKASIMFGGGFLLFLALKSSAANAAAPASLPSTSGTASFDNSPAPTKENAEIVAIAYTDALKNGEPPARMTELNQEMMKEFGMRCYVDKSGQIVVCDVKGNTVTTK